MSGKAFSGLEQATEINADDLLAISQKQEDGSYLSKSATVEMIGAASGSGDVSVPEFGGPGDSGLFRHSNNSTDTYNPGVSIPGSSLNYCCINADLSEHGNEYQGSGTYATGTWRVNGLIQNTNSASASITVCIRIDDTTLHQTLLHSSNGSQIVRNPVYSAADNSTIDCEVLFKNRWHPFTASPTDCTVWGREIYQRAVAGEFGEVATYPTKPEQAEE